MPRDSPAEAQVVGMLCTVGASLCLIISDRRDGRLNLTEFHGYMHTSYGARK